ncbi:MAG: BREX-3 system P-loop-containing protein BrxF [Ktedonobacteraceae bacterium]
MGATWEEMDSMWLQMALDRFLESRPYYPCCLLVSRDVAVLAQAVVEVKRLYPWQVISMDDVVSEQLLPLPVKARAAQVGRLINLAFRTYESGPLLVIDTDVLFEPSLQLDPLLLFQHASRQLPLVVTWSGSFEQGRLNYAVPEHAHYRLWRSPDLCQDCIIQLDS